MGGAIFNQIRIELEKGEAGDLTQLVPKLMYAAVQPYLGPEAAMEDLNRAPPSDA
jgi:hypothetical protein